MRCKAGDSRRERPGIQRTSAWSSVKRLAVRRAVRPAAACALFASALSACGAGTRPQPGLAADMQVREVYGCRAESLPVELAGAGALVDTARLSPAIRGLWAAGERPAGGDVVMTLWYDGEGVNVRRDLVQHSLTPVLADSLQKLVFAALAPGGSTGFPWGTRLHITAGPQVGYTLEPRQYCPPRPRSRALEAEMEAYLGTGTRYREGRKERTVLMRVRVHPNGWVEDARLERGAPSGGSLEQRLRRELRRFTFVPASLDGVPVYGELSVPIRVRG